MLRDTLEQLRHERRTVFLVTHNLAQGLELSDRWVILSRGKIVEQGRSDETDRLDFEQRYFERFAAAAEATRDR
jgi:ABC-type multidrug transport system ATPase subunit